VSQNGAEYELSIRLGFDCTNNQAEYEALLSGLEVLVDMEARNVMIFGDLKFGDSGGIGQLPHRSRATGQHCAGKHVGTAGIKL
jgi:hypothetical protein